MKRKDFLVRTVLLCGAGTFLHACKGIKTIQAVSENDEITLDRSVLDENTPVIIQHKSSNGPVLLSSKGNHISAVSMICTHKGCELNASRSRLVCPCHGSEFTINGKVLSPPASRDLKKYNVTVIDEKIKIHL